jgi:hypothetical protein
MSNDKKNTPVPNTDNSNTTKDRGNTGVANESYNERSNDGHRTFDVVNTLPPPPPMPKRDNNNGNS